MRIGGGDQPRACSSDGACNLVLVVERSKKLERLAFLHGARFMPRIHDQGVGAMQAQFGEHAGERVFHMESHFPCQHRRDLARSLRHGGRSGTHLLLGGVHHEIDNVFH